MKINCEKEQDVSGKTKYLMLAVISFLFVIFGLLTDHLARILEGLLRIIKEQDILITDYISIGGIGAAFVNAGILMLLSTAILYKLKAEITGISVAAVFLMGSFALFGKNIFNVWPIIIGVFLYAKLRRENLKKYIYIAFFGTSMAPAVTEFIFIVDMPLWFRIPLGIIIGLSIGFVLPPLSAHMFHIHKGCNLYNVGFTVGILGTVYVSVFKSYGYVADSRLIWSMGNDRLLAIFLSVLFISMLTAGIYLRRKMLWQFKRIFSHSGRGMCDFVALEGFGSTLINMALNGFVAMAYVLLARGALNGPTIGGILTVVGFGAYGKHTKNIIPIFLGVVIGGLTKTWSISDPPILLAALFGTALAPIAGHYGWLWGMAAGFINSSVVLNSGILHGGMNLYNTGFSAGIVAAVMFPIMETFKRIKPKQINTKECDAA